ncbi:GNAT family N-acetyltransferase [Robbsia sp. KACC 23696]|uniref:GNAT family N-acetyltransferase n=1 Tax=Robbsia sp. KACC 23696 TaxID=3149231 RepID=UPI00325C1BC7
MYFLRRADPADADALRVLTADDEAAWGYACPLLPSTEWWRNKIKRAEGLGLFIVAQRSNSNELVAFIEIGNDSFQPMRRHVGSIGLCVRRDYRRKGIGRALLTKAIEWSDQWLALSRLEITVWEAHVAAIRLYESLGFAREGIHPSYGFGAGGYRCAISMARLKPMDETSAPPAVALSSLTETPAAAVAAG